MKSAFIARAREGRKKFISPRFTNLWLFRRSLSRHMNFSAGKTSIGPRRTKSVCVSPLGGDPARSSRAHLAQGASALAQVSGDYHALVVEQHALALRLVGRRQRQTRKSLLQPPSFLRRQKKTRTRYGQKRMAGICKFMSKTRTDLFTKSQHNYKL